jgi:hypothetical protein
MIAFAKILSVYGIAYITKVLVKIQYKNHNPLVVVNQPYFMSQVYIMPPMARKTPYWYRRYYPHIMTSFREAFRSCEEGLLVLPCFPDPIFEKDYIHLNEDSGPS